MPSSLQEMAVQLWMHWRSVLWQLRPACSRLRSFLWFAVCVAGMTVRTDLLGVTSTVRALGLRKECYDRLLDSFHSSAIALLARTAGSVFAVPLANRIHEGVVASNRDQRTLLDKMVLLLDSLCIKEPFYFVADAYYASGKVILAVA